MRIKKTSQTTPVQAEVVNDYSTSQENAYSCDYINPKVLWTNSSPSSTFSSQTISDLDLSNYTTLEIYAIRYNLTDSHILCYKILLEAPSKSSQMFYCDYDNGLRSWNRNITWTTSSISFGSATINSSTSNGALIPYKIIGYK